VGRAEQNGGGMIYHEYLTGLVYAWWCASLRGEVRDGRVSWGTVRSCPVLKGWCGSGVMGVREWE
jgi:hypothetical protein